MAGTTLAHGSSVTLTLAATDSILLNSAAGAHARIEAVSGVAGASNQQVIAAHSGGKATYGPFGAGTVRVNAVGGSVSVAQGMAPLFDELSMSSSTVPFSAILPLSSLQSSMGAKFVDGAIAFSDSAGAAVGASATVDLVADGSNTPTFAGMFPTNGSADYLNVAGAINSITFYRASGVTWYSITNNAVAYSQDIAYAIVPTATEYVTDEGGGVYAGTSSAGSNAGKIIIDRYLPAGGEGSIQADFPAGGTATVAMGFDNSASLALVLGNCDKSVQLTSGGQLRIGVNGAPVDVSGAIFTPGASVKIRLRRARDGVFACELTTDGGATWTQYGSMGSTNTGTLYPHFYCTYSGSPFRLNQPKQTGLVPV